MADNLILEKLSDGSEVKVKFKKSCYGFRTYTPVEGRKQVNERRDRYGGYLRKSTPLLEQLQEVNEEVWKANSLEQELTCRET